MEGINECYTNFNAEIIKGKLIEWDENGNKKYYIDNCFSYTVSC